ncbi:MAG: FKBP-type peptidyl-prolyl cis-trans isomerase [Treponema sp.]|nr:FKBP-type peptidyl-prolyl cis-trans isomerase [Treponema sp.]MCL2272503.1 FKBP-type peptidyl-prolyl cis-trans isomerase [Treponema sp.]
MKKLFVFFGLFFAVFALHAKGIQEDIRLAEEKERVSYAFGMLFGSNLSATPLDFDYNAFTEGFRVMLENGEPKLSEQEAVEIVETAMHNAMEKTALENQRIENEFLIRNSQRSGVQVTPSGLQYEIISEGSGDKPQSDSVVRVNYTGTFTDGNIFDKSDSNGAYIPLEMVIPGWTEGLMLMNEGSVYNLYIPSAMAYGKNGVQNVIPPYSTLIFNVELLEITKDEE